MLITVKTLTGRKLTFEVDETMTFGDLRKEISEKEGIEVSQIRMIYGGHLVNDLHTIHESNVAAGSILHLVLSLRGG
jgi:ubiquitin-like protein Nedd8